MKKRLMLIMLAVLTALCLAACAGCNEETPSKPSDTTYTVTVQDTENGTVSVSATSVKKGESVVITVTPDEHYVLDVLEVNGNAVAVTGNTYTVASVDANITVSATFKKQTVTVTFDRGNPATATVTVGETYGELPSVTGAPGNRFIGWFTEENGGGLQILPTTVVTKTEDHTLYPYFTDKLVVTFDYGAGVGTEPRREVAANDVLGELPETEAPLGGILYGWFVGEERIDAEYVITEDVTVRASYITAEIALADGSGTTAVGGTVNNNVAPEIIVSVKLDGKETDVELDIETTDGSIAEIVDGAVVALGDGEVYVKAALDGVEVTRSEFVITCRSYAEYRAVTNKTEFLAIKDDKAGKYYIAADIDLEGAALWDVANNYAPIFGVFTGVIDGLGHTVSNATAHPSGWNAGAFSEMNGVVCDIAFTDMRTETGNCANNGFFGNVKGTVENVYLDIEFRYTGRADGTASWAALAYMVNNDAVIRDCVVNLRSSVATENVAAIACNAGGWTGVVENVFVIKNGLTLTSEFDGMYCGEAAAGVAEAQLKNSGKFDYIVELWNSTDVDATKLGGAWTDVDGALYFHGRKAMDATPEYVIVPSGDVELTFEDLEAEGKDQIIYSVLFIHDGADMNGEIPENVSTESSNAAVAELIFDRDESVFVLVNKSAGTAVITVKVGDYTGTFTVTLTQIIHIDTAQEFIEKISANPNGHFVIDADIDFASYQDGWVKKPGTDGESIASEFGGFIDGQNHVLKNMKLTDGNKGGLFARFSGTIKNVAFVNVTGQSANNVGGLFYEMYGSGLLQNVYLDYVMQGSGSAVNKAGPIAGKVAVANIDGVVINLRFADGVDTSSIENVGAIAGHANAWLAKVDNVKVILNGIALGKLKLAAAEAADGVSAAWTNCEQYADFAGFLGGSIGYFTEEKGWLFDRTGITFGNAYVLAIPEYTVEAQTAAVSREFTEGMEPFEIAVDVYNYIDRLEAYPDRLEVRSSEENVATVAVVDGKITVTALGVGTTVVTVSVGDAYVEISVMLALPAEADLTYDGETTLALDYETVGKTVETSIAAVKDGEAADIPADVTLGSDKQSVAEFVYNAETGKIDIVLNGVGNATLTAQIGAGTVITFNVTVAKIYHISTADEFRAKLEADLAGSFVLDNDIDLGGGFGGKTDGTAFGNFSGVLDGKGYKVSNFWLPGGWTSGGMFYELSGTVKNIAFINARGSGNANCSGLFYSINGGTVSNVYLDFEIQGAAIDATNGSGPLAYMMDGSDVENVVINLRVASTLTDIAALKCGAIVGRLCSWATVADNVKVILNGMTVNDVNLAYNDVTGTELTDWWKGKGCAVYGSYAEFAASDFAAFDGDVWTVDETGITFGSNKVLSV